MTPNDEQELTISEIRQLSRQQRKKYIERMRVFYPHFEELMDEIAWRHERREDAAEPPCMLLVARTRAGKTTLAKSYAALYPKVETEFGTERPVVFATVQLPATAFTLVTSLLIALGDPGALFGNVSKRRERLVKLFRDCKVSLLIIDEIQHFWDPDRMKTLQLVTNWLKTFIKETNVACLFIGLQGEAEHVIAENEQLAGLFGDPYVLEPFHWDETNPNTIEEFCDFLADLDAISPLRESSNFAHIDRAHKIFIASDGVVGLVMALVREAMHLALRSGQEYVDDELLAEGFDRRLAGKRRKIMNPFRDDTSSMLA